MEQADGPWESEGPAVYPVEVDKGELVDEASEPTNLVAEFAEYCAPVF